MKRNHISRLLICLALLVIQLALPTRASACSCVAGVTIPESFAQSDAIFTGKVVNVIDNYEPVFSTADSIMYKLGFQPFFFRYFAHNDERLLGFTVILDVINSWKGIDRTSVEVNTGRGGGDCGYSFTKNMDYLVYASYAYGIPGNYWVTSICSRTTEASNASDDFKYLNQFPTIPLKYALPIALIKIYLIILGPIFITVGGILFVRQRHNKLKKL